MPPGTNIVAFVFLIIFELSHSKNILFLPMPQSQSHRRSMYPLAKALAENGHRVTIFSEICTDELPKVENFEEKLVRVNIDDREYLEIFVYDNSTTFTDIMWNRGSMMDQRHIVFRWRTASMIFSQMLLQHYDEFLNLTFQKWDLIFVDGVFAPSGLALSALLENTPYVIFNPSIITSLERFARNIPNPSTTFPPVYCLRRFDQNVFSDRFHSALNYFLDLCTGAFVDWWYIRPALSSVSPKASLETFYKNPTVSFIDYPSAFNMPEPMVPDLVLVGGKCKNATLTDEKLLDFVNVPESNGTIVVAFGHMVKWNLAPLRIKQNFVESLNSFSDYRIVWQFKGELPSKVTVKSHIKLMSWLPQTEILNHRKTKLFISHGGLKSITEAVCGEVPAMVIPFFGDQKRNALLFEKTGSGIMLPQSDLTVDNIRLAMQSILNDDSFKISITRLKISMIERPLGPAETSIFWAEYILRHIGVPKAWYKHKGYDMLTTKYFAVDVILVFAFCSCLFIYFFT